MRAAALIVVSSAVTLAACSLFSLGGLTGGTPGDAGPDALGDVTSGDAAVDGAVDASGDTAAGDATQTQDGTTTDGGGGDAPVLPPYRIVFITSLGYTGNLGGAAGGDSRCQALAQPHFPGTFRAWLSDGKTTAASRMTPDSLPYVLADGQTVVASDWNVLLSGTLAHAIDMDEAQKVVAVDPAQTCCDGTGCFSGTYVWTDTDTVGSVWDGGSCANWTTAAGVSAVGGVGNAQDKNHWWTAWCYSTACNTVARLYCVQQ